MFEVLLESILFRRGLPVVLVLLSALAVGLSPSSPGPAYAENDMQPRKQDDGDHTPGRAAAWDVVDDGANAQPAPTAAGLATAATDCLGWPTRRIRYTSDGVIHLEGCGQTFVLSDIPAAGIGADKLEQVDPANKIWL